MQNADYISIPASDAPVTFHGPATPGVLENIIREIQEHDCAHPDHGVGCACHDMHAATLRRLFDATGLIQKTDSGYRAATKSLSNLRVVLGYVERNP